MREPYHVENLRLLLTTVAERYGDLLDPEDLAFIQVFEQLPAAARNLYTRLVCRQAPCFRASQLRYEDIVDLATALSALLEAEFILLQSVSPADAFHITPKGELLQWFNAPRKLKKPELIAHLHASHPEPELSHILFAQDRWISVQHSPRVAKFELCFFGNRHQKLNEFVITELGHVTYEIYDLSENTRYFNSRNLLAHTFALSQLQHQLDTALRGADIETLADFARQLPPPLEDARYTRRRARVLHELGREAERRLAWPLAESLYQQSGLDSSLERLARHALKQQSEEKPSSHEQARHYLKTILSRTHDPEHYANAWQLLRRLSPDEYAPRFEPASQTIALPLTDDAIELQAAAYFERQGHWCIYVENLLFNGLLGLLFWDIIFQPVPGAFANRFQRAPLDLYEPEFQTRRQADITARLRELEAGQAASRIAATLQDKLGIANTLIHWEFFESLDWQRVLTALPPRHLSLILQRMLQDLGQHRAGFPDLFCVDNNGNYQLLEVKGPNDKLRENQRAWLEFFAHHDIPAAVILVEAAPQLAGEGVAGVPTGGATASGTVAGAPDDAAG